MKGDEPIDEIREVRSRISARFDHDPVRLVEYYIKLQEQHRDRLIDLSKPPEEEQIPHESKPGGLAGDSRDR